VAGLEVSSRGPLALLLAAVAIVLGGLSVLIGSV
jgi:hypothetical protein